MEKREGEAVSDTGSIKNPNLGWLGESMHQGY
jgi:hypothetical protein